GRGRALERVAPRADVWVEHQRAVLALAELPGVDQGALAAALVDACCWQGVAGRVSPLDPDVFAWMMRWASDRVYEAAGDQHRGRGMRAALWTFTDPVRCSGWWSGGEPSRPSRASCTATCGSGGCGLRGMPAEWSRRAHALCDARLERIPFGVDPAFDPVTSTAQVRLACTYAGAGADPIVRQVAGNVRRYRTGDPSSDIGLVWWPLDEEEMEILRTLLEAAGPAGARAPLVDAAREAGLIDAEAAEFLGADIPRPAWMDGEVGWEAVRVVDAGSVHVPDGRLSAADPYWAFEGLPFEVDVPPGRHPVRLTLAAHPLHGRAVPVAELVIDGAAPVTWEPVGSRYEDEGCGYRAEVGVGCFGAA